MKRAKAILIIGGSGYIGTQLALGLRSSYKVFATYHSNRISIDGVTSFPVNASDRESVKRLAFNIVPDVIIYAAGRDDINWAENHSRDAERVHTAGAAAASTVASLLGARVIYLSNPLVFDGRKGNYHENDVVLPYSVIGKSKVAGENYIRGRSLNHVIIRCSPLFGRGNGRSLSLLDQLRVNLHRGVRMELSDHELYSYTYVKGLSGLIVSVLEEGLRNVNLHYGGLTKLTPMQFGRAFAERFGYNPDLIQPISVKQQKVKVDIPIQDHSLNVSKTVKALKIKPLLLEEAFDLLEKDLIT